MRRRSGRMRNRSCRKRTGIAEKIKKTKLSERQRMGHRVSGITGILYVQ
jgi:hypothetical protein